jgi:hypothetical protein
MASYGSITQAIETIKETLDYAINDDGMDPKDVRYLKNKADILMKDIDRFWKGI